jgi:peroxiredoxin Q/BCP
VLGISTGDAATLRRFKQETRAPYPLLSDEGGKVAKQYAGLVPVVGFSNRANVVVGKDGKVKEIVEGGDAIDPSAAVNACSAQ